MSPELKGVPINLDRNRGFGKWREISARAAAAGATLSVCGESVIGQGDLENPDENWVLLLLSLG